jgi:CheY-like chemotaxis protein
MALVQDQRFNVTTTTYVPRTFDQIAALQPDLLIVDLALRRQAGWELLVRLQVEGLTRLIPVVVTSTDPMLLRRADAQRERFGGDHYMVKP